MARRCVNSMAGPQFSTTTEVTQAQFIFLLSPEEKPLKRWG